jgi:histidine triad (HIT) family protein
MTTTMSDDYYCDFILNGRVSVNVVAETERVLAFHHVFRTWDTHIVIIPKTHVRSLADVDDPGLLAELFEVVIRIIKEQGFDTSNYKVITNGGSYQSNQHLHIHLVSGRPLSPESPGSKGELAV